MLPGVPSARHCLLVLSVESLLPDAALSSASA